MSTIKAMGKSRPEIGSETVGGAGIRWEFEGLFMTCLTLYPLLGT